MEQLSPPDAPRAPEPRLTSPGPHADRAWCQVLSNTRLFGQFGLASPSVSPPGFWWKLTLSWPNSGQLCRTSLLKKARFFTGVILVLLFWCPICLSTVLFFPDSASHIPQHLPTSAILWALLPCYSWWDKGQILPNTKTPYFPHLLFAK